MRIGDPLMASTLGFNAAKAAAQIWGVAFDHYLHR
jgi:hypothetical protein